MYGCSKPRLLFVLYVFLMPSQAIRFVATSDGRLKPSCLLPVACLRWSIWFHFDANGDKLPWSAKLLPSIAIEVESGRKYITYASVSRRVKPIFRQNNLSICARQFPSSPAANNSNNNNYVCGGNIDHMHFWWSYDDLHANQITLLHWPITQSNTF